jgi:signal peptidase I
LLKKILRDVGITILIAIAIFAFLRVSFQGYMVRGSCMLPGIENQDWVMVSKAAYFFSDPQHGDIIILKPPISASHPFIKRVIAVPGDTIEVKDGKVYLNDIALTEPYVSDPPRYTLPAREIPEGEYFVLGDNRNSADDSHVWGTVPGENILGKAWFIYWPLERWGGAGNYNYPELASEQEEIMTVSQTFGVEFE